MKAPFWLLFLFAAVSLHAAENRITEPVDLGRNIALKRHLNPAVQAVNDQGPVDAAMAIDYATLMLEPAPGLEAFLAEQQYPSSAVYHRWLTPEQFAERFGASASDIAALTVWLRSQGLQVNDVARGHLWITFSGSADRVGAAFHTVIHRYVVNGELHYANSTELAIPAAFASVVRGVDGLTDFVPAPQHTRSGKQPEYNSTNGFHYLSPGDLAVIYNTAPLYQSGIDGTGQKIAVIGRTDIDLNDIRSFRTRFHLPDNDPHIILYGPDPGLSLGDEEEADLDLEWSGAMAPGATILYVNSRSVNTSAQYAVDQNLASVMTMSYGSCEPSTIDILRPVAQQANAEGITWMVSSGDSGAATCDRTAPSPVASKGATTSYPASIPEVTAVGGTEFTEENGTYWKTVADSSGTSALSWIPETVWNDSPKYGKLVGGGGAPSVLFTKPVWQSGPGVPADGFRDVPDVSLTSSAAHDAYLIYNEGFLAAIGGTSASAPAFAGIVALLNQSLPQPGLGNMNPALYRLAQSTSDVFHDVTQGNNQVPCQQGSPQCLNGLVGFAAGPGYDLATGLGSVDAARLIAEWNVGTVSTTTLSAPVDKLNPGDVVQLTAVVSGDKGVPTGTVTFVANEVILGAVALTPQDKSASAGISLNATLLLGGSGIVGALYGGDSVFAPSAGSAIVVPNLPATNSFVIPSVSPNPVYGSNGVWPYTFKLSEHAGVATKVTAFTVNGANNLVNLPSTTIPANGSISNSLQGLNLAVPLNRVFHFAGVDADGTTWTRDLTVPFLAAISPGTLAPSIVLTVASPSVRQNPAADATCQWTEEVSVQERAGFLVQLTSLTQDGVSQTSRIPQLFGTTRLAPYGALHATVCFATPLLNAAPVFSLLVSLKRDPL